MQEYPDKISGKESGALMRNEMQELNVKDWKERLKAYLPQNVSEEADKRQILQEIRKKGDALLFRTNTAAHFTCSGFVMDPEFGQVLMVYHHIYDSFSWTGGHADGSSDFLAVAVREVKEETGVEKPFPQSGAILSLDVLPVPAHEKHGKSVECHKHYNITYGLIVNPKEKLRIKPDENSAVQWIPVENLKEMVKEQHMLPIYEKLIARMRKQKQMQTEVMAQIAAPLLTWYPSHARDLPWRRTKEPYRIWLSEVMLQQTRVEAVKGYYQRFLENFPDVQSLAAATQDQVNKCWEGLGYYTRAANLRKAAQVICTEHRGVFPDTYAAVRRLPGVGEYTAGAVCSICYEQPTPAVDGNVLRVIARVTDCFCEIDRPAMKQAVTEGLRAVYAEGNCGMLTQSLMELGATVCLPNGQPLCSACPLAAFCMGRKNQDVLRLPQRTTKKKRRTEQYTVFLMRCEGKYAVQKRQEKGLLHGLWEFPNVPGIHTAEEAIQMAASWGTAPKDLVRTAEKKHIFTHVEWELFGVYLDCGRAAEPFVWKSPEEIAAEISLPTAFRQFALDLP